MKISLTTLAVLVSATAVHALPGGPPVPPPLITDDLSGDIEDAADGAGLVITGALEGIPHLIADILDAKARRKAWRNEQERLKAEADEKELREALDARRKIAEGKLEYAEQLQSAAEKEARQADKDQEAAFQGLAKARAELEELAVRHRAAEVQVEHAAELQTQAKVDVEGAEKDLGKAVKVADDLREAVAKIDEQAAIIGIPDDDKYLVNPKYPKPTPPPEEPKGHKKSHHGHRNNRRGC